MEQAPKPGSSSDIFSESICSVCDDRPDHLRKGSVLQNVTILGSDGWHSGTYRRQMTQTCSNCQDIWSRQSADCQIRFVAGRGLNTNHEETQYEFATRVAGVVPRPAGITGLETAIVLIAFVVVASVFAFAVLSTGLLSSEKSKETVLGGLAETSSTLSIRGDVIGDANSGKTALDTVKFTLTSAAQAADAVDLSSTGVVITYLDQDQALNCTNGSGSGDSYCFWTTD